MRGKPESTAVRSRPPKILVIGLGNFLLGDDGVGIHAVRRFQQLTPRPCPAVEVGTAIFSAVPLLEKTDRVLAFDAIEAKGRPGSVYLMRAEDLALEEGYDSLHEMGLQKILQMLRCSPAEVVIIGAEPHSINWGTNLTPALHDSVDLMVSAALKVVAEWRNPELGSKRVDLNAVFHQLQFEIGWHCILIEFPPQNPAMIWSANHSGLPKRD